jgi:hypothetical protein
VSNTAYFLNNIYVSNHVYDVQVQQLTVGNALVSVGFDNAPGLDSGFMINNALDGANVATFFRAQASTPTYYIGYVNSPTGATGNLTLATDRSLPVYVYGNVTASNGFIGSGSLLTGLTDATPNTTFGSASQVPQISIDSTGKISGITNASISITSDKVSNLVAAVANLTALAITGTLPFTQVSGANLQTLTNNSGNVTTNRLQLLGGLVTNSYTGIANTIPAHPFVIGASNVVVGTNGSVGINTVPNNAQMTIVNSTGSQTVLAVSGNSNQTANLQTWATTNGTIVASVSNIGEIKTTSVTRTVPVVYSNNATVTSTDNWIIANNAGSANDFYLNLPAPSSCPGREMTIRKYLTQYTNGINTFRILSHSANVRQLYDYATINNVIIDTGGTHNTNVRYGDTIYKWVTLVSDGTNWVGVAGA